MNAAIIFLAVAPLPGASSLAEFGQILVMFVLAGAAWPELVATPSPGRPAPTRASQ